MLKNKVSIYVPSTYRDHAAPENIINFYVADTLKKLSVMFGGATATKARGAYMSNDGALIMEDITVCYSYCEEYDKSALVDICRDLKTVFMQEAVSLEINNTLEFI